MKTIYTDWHKTFPGSGQGKQYPWLLDSILNNHKQNRTQQWHSFVDYGAGKGGTAQWLESLIPNITVDCYDPGNPQYSTPPTKHYDCLYSADVLEHIEREDLPETLDYMTTLADEMLVIIDLTPAKKHLPDGRNAHVTLLSQEVWQVVLEEYTGWTTQQQIIYSIPDPNFNKRTRLCVHLKP